MKFQKRMTQIVCFFIKKRFYGFMVMFENFNESWIFCNEKTYQIFNLIFFLCCKSFFSCAIIKISKHTFFYKTSIWKSI